MIKIQICTHSISGADLLKLLCHGLLPRTRTKSKDVTLRWCKPVVWGRPKYREKKKEKEISGVWSEAKVPVHMCLERVEVLCRGEDGGGKRISRSHNDKRVLTLFNTLEFTTQFF